MNDLFVSYRRKDAKQVGALVDALRDEGLKVWIDREEIEDAASIQQRIEDGLAHSRALLAWYSLDYPKSRACQWELTAALIAAGADPDPARRILIVNPEAGADHVHPLPLRDRQHFAANDDPAGLARRIAAAVRPVQGTLGALRQLTKPPWHGMQGLGSNRFVGRVADLWNIHSALTAGQCAIVSGLPAPHAASDLAQLRGSGGIGKSLLAEEYAMRFGTAWPGGVFWLRAEGNDENPDVPPDALASRREAVYGAQLAAFAVALGIDIRDKTDPQLRAELARRLAEPYLWIVDDLPACDRSELQRWLAPSSQGRTLVTTRNKRLDGVGRPIDLGVLPSQDARELLTRDHPPQADEEAAVAAILEYLDGHALALDVARAACRDLGYAGFRQRLELQDHDALALAVKLAPKLPNDHNPHIAITLLTSIRRLGNEGMDVLRLAAQLAAAPIPRDLIAACLASADGLDAIEAEDRAAIGIRQVLDHSLAEAMDSPKAIVVHALITRTLRHHDTDRDRQQRLRRAALETLCVRMSEAHDIRNHERLQAIVPHAQWLARDASDHMTLALVGWLGRYEYEAGRYVFSARWYQLEVGGRASTLGEEDLSTLTSKGNLASALFDQGDISGARILEEQVLAVRRRVQGEEHEDTLISMGNLANTLRAQGDLPGARGLAEKVVNACRRKLGEDHLHTLTGMNNLASMLRAQGDLSSARGLQEKVVSIRRREPDEDHQDTLISMGNLASTLTAQGDLHGARDLEEQVLADSHRVRGDRHSNTSIAAWNLYVTLTRLPDIPAANRVLDDHLRWLIDCNPDDLSADQRRVRAMVEQIASQ
ncbi:MAG: toll/interleukin-1 receptor domain-containing protein [Chromatiales bacterium]|jgi:hypothetical protein|nr:toll/interleukin-1 receptor domain-containing protein [Chromatiales bacterium]MDX9767602.1 toll/interleukin-1 receptor domain-containing protein [Ectothiorhodospiraceae bacterium]